MFKLIFCVALPFALFTFSGITNASGTAACPLHFVKDGCESVVVDPAYPLQCQEFYEQAPDGTYTYCNWDDRYGRCEKFGHCTVSDDASSGDAPSNRK